MQPLAVRDPPQDELGADGRDDGEGGSLVRFEDAEIDVRRDQDARDEDWRQQPVVELQTEIGSSRFLHAMKAVGRRAFDRLGAARRPPNRDFADLGGRSETVVKPALILGAEAAPTADLLHLPLPVPLDFNAGADCAAIADGALELECNPVPARADRVRIHEERATLIRDNHVEGAAVRQIRECDRAAVMRVARADVLRDLREPACAVVYPQRVFADTPTGSVPASAASCWRRR